MQASRAAERAACRDHVAPTPATDWAAVAWGIVGGLILGGAIVGDAVWLGD